MKLNVGVYTFISCFAFMLSYQQGYAGALSELSLPEQEKLKNGEQVAQFLDSGIPHAPWPICKVYQKVNATPLEAAAVFSDFEIQSTYVPNLTQSHVSSRNRGSMDVSYQLTMPMGFGVEKYVAHDTFSSYDGGLSYAVEWKIDPTPSIKESHGRARFEPFENGTLIVYENFIFPLRWGSSLGWVVEKSKKQVKDTVTAIINQVYSEQKNHSDVLKAQMDSFQDLLKN